jgi:hypothetical protein
MDEKGLWTTIVLESINKKVHLSAQETDASLKDNARWLKNAPYLVER